MNIHKKGKNNSSYKSKSLKKYKRRINHCKHCEAVYKSKAVRDDHVLKKHPEFIASVTSKIHRCEICTYKTTIKVELDRHMLKHPDVKSNYKLKLNTCLHCKATFKSKATMDDHIIRKHPECMESVTSKKYTCIHCNAAFKSKRTRDGHVAKKHPKFIASVASKIHECGLCTYKTTHKSHFNNHMPDVRSNYTSKTARSKVIHCKHCNAVYKSKQIIDDHVLKKHPEFIASVKSKIHECGLCTYKTTIKLELDRHMLKHPETESGYKHKFKSSACLHCEKSFTSKATMDDHIIRKHPEFMESVTSKVHECKVCLFKTTNKRQFELHTLRHPDSYSNYTPKVHACRVCGTVFKSKISMDDHIVKHHTECVESVTSKIHECKICLYRTTFKHCFDAHMLKHPELNPTFKFHTCMVCNSAFKSRIGMDDHIVKLHPESIELVTSRIHECKSCVYKTTYKDRFDTHMLRHPEADPSKFSVCVACNATFRSKQKMDDHVLKQHPEFTESVTSKIHECKVCLYRTTFKDRLSNHMATHPDTNTVNQPTCRHCNRSFNSRVAMDDHILKKHPTCIDSVTSKMHECELCTFKTTFKHNLDRHMLKQHTAGKSSS
nr:unnamed protein product [Callosobruchus chinensis]